MQAAAGTLPEPAPGRAQLRLVQNTRVPNALLSLTVRATVDVAIETSCETGICGTCRTRYLTRRTGSSAFRSERRRTQREFAMLCCAGSKTPPLVLDM